jgi:hypothetical protein
LKSDRFVFMASERWHALVYEAHLHNMRPGDTFSYRDVCRTVFSALIATDSRIRNGRYIYAAITALLFHLRRHNWVTFETSPGPGTSTAQSKWATRTLAGNRTADSMLLLVKRRSGRHLIGRDATRPATSPST